MNRPSLAIITCVRNQEKYLPDLLASVASQTNKDFEHILIDGQSTDKTRNIIQKYREDNLGNYAIPFYTFPPLGIAHAMNQGIELATAPWILIVHGDDFLRDGNSVSRILSDIEKNPKSSWLIGNSVRKIGPFIFSTRMHWARKFIVWMLRYFNFVPHQNTLMRRELFVKFGNFLEDIPVSMDHEFYLRLMSHGVFPTSVDNGYVVFRRHLASTSLNPFNYLGKQNRLRKLFRKYREILDLTED